MTDRANEARSARAQPAAEETLIELRTVLSRVAERVVERGTVTESRILEAMSDAGRELCPGAAAALVDWGGSEIARLRAFGLVHGALLRGLGPSDRAWLLNRILGRDDLALAG